MKKPILIFLCILLAALTGCASSENGRIVSILTPAPQPTAAGFEPAPTERSASVDPSQTSTASPLTAGPTQSGPTAVPTAAPTDVPVPSPTAEPTYAPFVPENAEQAIARYESYPLGYTPIEREAVGPNEPVEEPRYTLGSDGIYHSETSSPGSEAVIMIIGDLMCQSRQQLACRKGATFDFNCCFTYVKDLFSKADFVVGNLESTLCASAPYMSEETFIDGSPNLNAPAVFLEALRGAGYDMVVMANNHNCDAGVRGIYDTIDHVEEYDLLHTGLFRNNEETRYTIIEINGINVCFLSYATYFNHKEEHLTNEGVSALLNFYSQEAVERDVAAARAAGAEYVFCYIHWGVEYKNDPDLTVTIPMTERLSGQSFSLSVPLTEQLTIAQELADAGVDYILGSHPHALQPYEVLTSSDGRSVPVIYSLGNFVSHQKKDISKDTMILRVALERDSSGNIRITREGYVPARMHVSYKGSSYTVIPLTSPYNNGNHSDEFTPAYRRIVQAVGRKLSVMGSM